MELLLIKSLFSFPIFIIYVFISLSLCLFCCSFLSTTFSELGICKVNQSTFLQIPKCWLEIAPTSWGDAQVEMQWDPGVIENYVPVNFFSFLSISLQINKFNDIITSKFSVVWCTPDFRLTEQVVASVIFCYLFFFLFYYLFGHC